MGGLARRLGAADLGAAWQAFGAAPWPFATDPMDAAALDAHLPGETARIRAAADTAMARTVDLLGSGPYRLAEPVDWLRDIKFDERWLNDWAHRLDLRRLHSPCDVKVPWELSRLQWLVPVGQAHLLDGDDGRAAFVRRIVEEWDAANPLARSVNWACTMDVALRAVALAWLGRACGRAPSWDDAVFRERFLALLWLHGDYVVRHLEWSDVNGNHLVADLAGLVVLGHLFPDGPDPRLWCETAWRHLCAEIESQVTPDGAGFEGSAAYHRLVAELFLAAAAARRAAGADVPTAYAERLRRMAVFTTAYTRADGSAPLWGDADDGRLLPFGGQDVNDHRYLVGLVAGVLADPELAVLADGGDGESPWWFDPAAAPAPPATRAPPVAAAFADAGVYVLCGDRDHVFVDAGPVGMGGRGGHGHNDCLGFEAHLAGVPLVTDCGAYLYTAAPDWRNRLRGTAVHNTPMVDGAELNRFVDRAMLFTLRDDARPEVRAWSTTPDRDVLEAAHSGYRRLAPPVTPVRRFVLDKGRHRLLVADRFEGACEHHLRTPYHLAPGVTPAIEAPGAVALTGGGGPFLMLWRGGGWSVALADGWQSPSYGVKRPIRVVVFERQGPMAALAVALLPAPADRAEAQRWLDATLAESGLGGE